MFLGVLLMGVMLLIIGKLFDKFGVCVLVVIGLMIIVVMMYFFSNLEFDMMYIMFIMFYMFCMFGMFMVMMLVMINGLN